MAHCSEASCSIEHSINAAERVAILPGQAVELPQWRRQEDTAYSMGIYSGVVTAVRGQRLDITLVEDPHNPIGQGIHRRSVRLSSWSQADADVLPVCSDSIEAGFVEFW